MKILKKKLKYRKKMMEMSQTKTQNHLGIRKFFKKS